MRLRSVHPGVNVADVVEQTGFPLQIAEPVPTTPLPSAAQLDLLRRVIDRDNRGAREVPS